MAKKNGCPPGYKRIHRKNGSKCVFLKSIGYNSHGKWSTLSELREIEKERGNLFPKAKLPDSTPAIWINFDKRTTLRYLVSADDWDRIEDRSNRLTQNDKNIMGDIVKINLRKEDKIIFDDGDEGYLLVRKK